MKNKNTILLSKIKPDPNNPRQEFDPVELVKLEASIKENGILTPLTVEETDGSQYLLVDGERRYRVAKNLKLTEVPVTILEQMSDIERLVKRFHLQELHSQWNDWERSSALAALRNNLSDLNNVQVAALLGVSPGMIEKWTMVAATSKRMANQIISRKKPFEWLVEMSRISRVVEDGSLRKDLEDSLIQKIDDKVILRARELRKYRASIIGGGIPIVKKIIASAKYTPEQATVDSGTENLIPIKYIGNGASQIISYGPKLLSGKRVILPARVHARLVKAKKLLDKLVDLDIEDEE